ncbi:hypothetical protein [Bacillus pinisoli]|uniref:hypothetical protein n=1 Tax=Bacillus pinisoli TaxID=2901866 RepID=UPI001FF2AD27|nr:hypothetical protein [Bacillus pinisoli]
MGEFLPILVAIAFGIYSFYKKNIAQEDQEKRKPMLPPNLDPMHPKHYESRKPVEVSRPQEAPREKPRTETYTRPIPVQMIQEQPVRVHENHVKVKSIKEKSEGNQHPAKMPAFTRERLVEGVIMAEVLGPPRAHKPHHTNKVSKLSR